MIRLVRKSRIALVLFTAGVTAAGCEKEKALPSPPPPAVTTAPTRPAVAASRPTTQALLDAPRKALVLGALPLVMDVPASWNIETSGETTQWLVGPTPHGEVRIQLSVINMVFASTTLTTMDEQFRKEAAGSNGMAEAKPLRALSGGAKLREQREIHPGIVIDGEGKPRNTDVMDWSVEVYVPQDKGYAQNLLHFAMLPVDQYRLDKEFLEKIVASVRYDATKGLLQ